MTIHQFVCQLKSCRGKLPSQTLRTLRGQALAGDVDGAVRGLTRLLEKQSAGKP